MMKSFTAALAAGPGLAGLGHSAGRIVPGEQKKHAAAGAKEDGMIQCFPHRTSKTMPKGAEVTAHD